MAPASSVGDGIDHPLLVGKCSRFWRDWPRVGRHPADAAPARTALGRGGRAGGLGGLGAVGLVLVAAPWARTRGESLDVLSCPMTSCRGYMWLSLAVLGLALVNLVLMRRPQSASCPPSNTQFLWAFPMNS